MPAWQNTKFKRVFKWRYMAESTQGSFQCLKILKSGALDVVIQFNDGYKGCVEMFKKLNITPGYFTLKAYKHLDINRINDAERHSTPNVHSDGENTHWWCVGAPCKEYVTRDTPSTAPPPPKVNFWEERARKKKEMMDAAKSINSPPDQPKRPPSAHIEEMSSSFQPKDQSSSQKASPQTREPSSSTQGMSSSLPNASSTPATPQVSPTLMDTSSHVNDPEVQEMIDVVQKFVQISKQNKPRAQRALELFTLLRIKF
ncbi:hypothetical protein TNCV_4327061 [Trichonephila clavipes]|nr:hypothetical protein TNCV_4327061 [Trichonephila clavipes]